MAEVTSPLLLDGTGQTIISKLEGIRAVLAAEVTPATTATAGIVKPDGTTITIDANGVISAVTQQISPATTATAGIVKPDGTTISVDTNGKIAANIAIATTAVAGTVKPDGKTITLGSNGLVKAQAGTISFASFTLVAANWSNSIYSFESTYPSSSYDILDIVPAETATDAERKAWIQADCGGYRSTNTIQAHGTVPTIAIPVMLMLRQK